MLTNTVFENAGVLDADFSQDVILSLAAGFAPVYSELARLNALRETGNSEFSWFTDTLPGRRTAINNGADNYNASSTSIVVDDGTVFQPSTLILFEATGEVGLVTAVSTNTLTVQRGLGSVVAAATASVADNATVANIGPASGEGANAPAVANAAATKITNYCQTFRQSIEISGRASAEILRHEEELPRQRRKKFQQLLEDIDQSTTFGAATESGADASSKRVTATAGLLQAITTHVDNVAGTMSLARFHQFTEKAGDRGSPEKIFFVGSTLATAIHTIYENKLQIQNGAQDVGLPFARILTPHGVTLRMVHHRGLKGTYAQYGIVVDPDQAEVRYMRNGRGRPHLVPRDSGTADAIFEEWMAELGLQYGDEATHAVIKGVTGAA